MRLQHSISAFLLISVFVYASAISQESGDERVSFQMRSKLTGPNISEGFVSTIRTFIEDGYESDKEYGTTGFRLHVVVEDARIYEFSVRLDLVDPDGAALDSTVVLARADRLAHFELAADDVTASGTIRVARKLSDEYGDNGLD